MSHSICKKVDWAKLPRELLFWNWVYSLADMGSEGSTNSYQQIIYDGRVCKLVLTCLLGPKSSPVHSILGTLFSPTFKAGILASICGTVWLADALVQDQASFCPVLELGVSKRQSAILRAKTSQFQNWAKIGAQFQNWAGDTCSPTFICSNLNCFQPSRT